MILVKLFLLFILSFHLYSQDEFDSSVVIEIKRAEKIYTCSGVVISKTTILTAAHCLEGEVDRVRIYLDKIYHRYNAYLEVKDYQIHPDYNSEESNFYSDIAKIKLLFPIETEISIQPVNEKKILKGQFFRVGFGGRNNSNQRTILNLELKKNSFKNKTVEFYETDSQSGDSGGPIFIKDGERIFLLAIHSTLSYGPQGKYSLNPNIHSFIEWIFLP